MQTMGSKAHGENCWWTLSKKVNAVYAPTEGAKMRGKMRTSMEMDSHFKTYPLWPFLVASWSPERLSFLEFRCRSGLNPASRSTFTHPLLPHSLANSSRDFLSPGGSTFSPSSPASFSPSSSSTPSLKRASISREERHFWSSPALSDSMASFARLIPSLCSRLDSVWWGGQFVRHQGTHVMTILHLLPASYLHKAIRIVK